MGHVGLQFRECRLWDNLAIRFVVLMGETKMARKSSKKSKSSNPLVQEELTKGQSRKLNALRKSVGDDIGTKAFNQWLKTQKKGEEGSFDKTAEAIAGDLVALIKEKNLVFPRGGYLLTRGRGRVIVTRAGTD